LFLLVIDRGFRADQDVGQLPVRSAPGTHHLWCGDLFAEHFGNGAQQAGTDDRVMLWQNLQGDVFVDDLRHQIAQLVELIDVPRVHQHAVGQGTRLIATGLMRLVEQRPHLRVFGEHHAVEMRDQRLAAAFQQRHGGFDDGTILDAKHKVTPGLSGKIALGISAFMPTN